MFGHIIRADLDDPLRMATLQEDGAPRDWGKKRVGRPRHFWAERVYMDVATCKQIEVDWDAGEDFLEAVRNAAANRERLFAGKDVSTVFEREKENENPMCRIIV